jgi:hypothetical protein
MHEDPKPDPMKVIEDAANHYVHGTRRKVYRNGTPDRDEPDLAMWSERFMDHPTVMRAEREGWAPSLRSLVRGKVRFHLLKNEPIPSVNDLMPPRWWQENERRGAVSAAAAERWRQQMIDKHGSVDAAITKRGATHGRTWASVTQSAYEAMQENSPNWRLHTEGSK